MTGDGEGALARTALRRGAYFPACPELGPWDKHTRHARREGLRCKDYWVGLVLLWQDLGSSRNLRPHMKFLRSEEQEPRRRRDRECCRMWERKFQYIAVGLCDGPNDVERTNRVVAPEHVRNCLVAFPPSRPAPLWFNARLHKCISRG